MYCLPFYVNRDRRFTLIFCQQINMFRLCCHIISIKGNKLHHIIPMHFFFRNRCKQYKVSRKLHCILFETSFGYFRLLKRRSTSLIITVTVMTADNATEWNYRIFVAVKGKYLKFIKQFTTLTHTFKTL